jgi:hypothetical protein
MGNTRKADVIEELRQRFGDLRKLPQSESLFALGDDAARVYMRYSKVHPRGRTFFGLRDVDLRQLEGHNSFLCFSFDDGSPPIFIPYVDFEEVFREAETASDGQYKVQINKQRQALELYVARQGRFNIEAYVGFDGLARSVDAKRLREVRKLSHSQVQTLLAGIGHLKGYEVSVPAYDAGRFDWSLTTQFRLRDSLPAGFEHVSEILSEIDVIWVAAGRNEIEGLFEVEHTTSVYSGLLRFNDILLTEPKVSRFSIVSNEARRAVFARQLYRPTFRKSGLAELTSFLEYANVFDWHERLSKPRTPPAGTP